MLSNSLLKYAWIAFLLVCGNAYSQMDSCNVFLQGNHIEIGIAPNGAYGSCVPAPTGYHPRSMTGSLYHPCSSSATNAPTPLGLVADPLLTRWSTGALHYMGDYFLSASTDAPSEGWEMQIGPAGNCVQAFGSTTTGFSGPITGTGNNISFSGSVDTSSSTWQGTFDSIEITQVTKVDSGGLFVMVELTLTNLSLLPVNNIYYFRSLHPGIGNSWWGGSFPTFNEIVYQGPDSSLVTAYGMAGTTTIMGLGTTDTNSRCLVYNTWPLSTSVDLATLYNTTYGPADYTAGTFDNGDDAIGLIYYIAHLATVDSAVDSVYRTTSAARLHPANSAQLTYFYGFGTAGIDSALSAFTPILPLAITNASNVTVSIYPNPSKDIFHISGLNTGDQLTLLDMMGRVVLRQAGNEGFNTISAGNLAAGPYILVVNDKAGCVKLRSALQKL